MRNDTPETRAGEALKASLRGQRIGAPDEEATPHAYTLQGSESQSPAYQNAVLCFQSKGIDHVLLLGATTGGPDLTRHSLLAGLERLGVVVPAVALRLDDDVP
jgi:hypothetical protein